LSRTCRAKLLRDVLGGFAVLGRGGEMGFGGEDFQVLTGQPGVGHGQKSFFNFGLVGEVGIAEDGGRIGTLSRERRGERCEEQECRKEEESEPLAHSHRISP
jgi:hypothetical protein